MKDEIKEVLDKLNNKAEHYILYNYEVKLLLDCITNLQEGEAYYYGQYKDYKSKNEKIIRKISLYRMDDITMESNRILNDLLNVALGEDKDEV